MSGHDLGGLWGPELVVPPAAAKSRAEAPSAAEPALDTIEAWAGSGPCRRAKRTRPSITEREWQRAMARARDYIDVGGWDDALARDFVAAHAVLHEKVYGVPLMLAPKERTAAAGAAKRVLGRDFGGEPGRLVKYLAWIWARERDRETWRRREGIDGTLRWQTVFGAAVNDYRAAAARRQSGAPGLACAAPRRAS